MYIQLNIELANGESKPASVNKDCSLQEAKADVFQVLNVAKHQFDQEIVNWNARFVDFDSAAQVLVFGESLGDGWVCTLKFIDCNEQNVKEAMDAWAVPDFKPSTH